VFCITTLIIVTVVLINIVIVKPQAILLHYDSVRREVLYNILIEFGILMKLLRLIKMCSNETCNRVCVGKHLFGMFPVKNGLKQGDALSPLLFNYALEYVI